MLSQQVEDLRLQGQAGRQLEEQLRKENNALKEQLLDVETKLCQVEDASRSVTSRVGGAHI